MRTNMNVVLWLYSGVLLDSNHFVPTCVAEDVTREHVNGQSLALACLVTACRVWPFSWVRGSHGPLESSSLFVYVWFADHTLPYTIITPTGAIQIGTMTPRVHAFTRVEGNQVS